MYSSSTCITHKYIAELLSVFSEYYYCIFGIFRLPSAILIHIHTSKYVKKLSNEKFLDIRELDENLITYYKEPKYIEWKSRHFLASLFANHLPFPFDIPWFITLIVLYMFSFFFLHTGASDLNTNNEGGKCCAVRVIDIVIVSCLDQPMTWNIHVLYIRPTWRHYFFFYFSCNYIKI